MPNTTNIQKKAVVARQVAGKLLAQSNKEKDPEIQAQLRQLAGKNISDANRIIKEEKQKQADKKKA